MGKVQKLALFDLDHTLLDGDSGHGWGEFLCRKGLVDAKSYREANDRFYEQYKRGELDIVEYLEFDFKPLSEHDRKYLEEHRQEFVEHWVKPRVLPKARDLVKDHQETGDLCMVITSTNRFVVEPIAKMLGVEELIATDPEEVDGRFTGKVSGKPSFQDGKVHRLREWLEGTHHSLVGASFYSDSHNDIPLLEEVDHPVAVDPDDELKAHAEKRGWKIISLR